MAFYIVNASHRDPLPLPPDEVAAALPDHQAHIAKGLADNRILFAGPKTAGKGGFIVIRAETRQGLDQFIADDPFCQKGIMDYEITEFMPVDRQPYIEPWL